MRTHLHSGAIVDTQSREKSLCYCLPVSLIIVHDELPSRSTHWACDHLTTHPNSNLCLQTSLPKPWLTCPPECGLWSHTTELWLPTPWTLCISDVPKPSRLGETCVAPELTPILPATRDGNAQSETPLSPTSRETAKSMIVR